MTEGFVEVRGGKFWLKDAPLPLPTTAMPLVAGDKIRIDAGVVTLLERKPFWTLGIVAGFGGGQVFLDYPLLSPPCRVGMCILQRVALGQRVIVLWEADGTLCSTRIYSSEAKHDVAVLLDLYKSSALTHAPVSCSITTPHYTRPLTDLTHLHTFTTDPESSVDLDDAISLDPVSRKLYVHIVDIHSQIPVGSAEDSALQTGVSTLYLANEHTEHLLSEHALRTLSLDKGVVRKAISVEMVLSPEGDIESYEIYPSRICVKERLCYRDLACLATCTPYNWLWDLAESRKSMVTLSIPGFVLNCDSIGELSSFRTESSNDGAHRSVAFAMIAANFAVSAHLSSRGVVIPNRFHQKLVGATAADIRHITGNEVVDSFMTLKRWRPAKYDLHEKGHFGLGLTDYVHFTSPMRRYADVLVHRMLAGVIYPDDWLHDVIEGVNTRSLFVKQLHKYYASLKISRHLMKNPSALSDVCITGISRAGVLWYNPVYLVNGFCHVSNIGVGIRWSFRDDLVALEGNGHHLEVGHLLKVEKMSYNAGKDEYEVRLGL